MSNTHIVVVLDRSGSMDTCKSATVSGFDEFVNKQKQEDGEATLTLVQFDDEYDVVYDAKDIQDVVSIADVYSPRGCTALLDAIGKAIINTELDLVMRSKSKQPDRVICVIITDGYENASKEYSRDTIVKKIRLMERGKWEFVFLGANIDAVGVAVDLGMKGTSAANYSTQNTNKAFQNMSGKLGAYRSASQADLTSLKDGTSCMFDAEEQEDLK